MKLINGIKTQHLIKNQYTETLLDKISSSDTIVIRKAIVDNHGGFSLSDVEIAAYFFSGTEKIDVSTYITVDTDAIIKIVMNSNGEQMIWPHDQSSIIEIITISGSAYALLPLNNKGRFILNVRKMGGTMNIDDNVAKLDLDIYTVKFMKDIGKPEVCNTEILSCVD